MIQRRGIRGSTPSLKAPAGRSGAQRSAAQTPGLTRALVPVQAVELSEQAFTHACRPAAAFLAHLIAVAQGEPQARERRRAEPLQAAQAYRAALAVTMGLNKSRVR